MADVVVVGAGLGGLAVSARLAKLGHRVTVLERADFAGGAVRRLTREGFAWDAGPSSTTLPAVLRDLFRKSGRPLERVLDLRAREPARRHVFDDGCVVDLPAGSRAAQTAAVDAGLGVGAGDAWTAFVDGLAPIWETLRTEVLDAPDGESRLASRRVASALSSRTGLPRFLRRNLRDERLRAMVDFAPRLAGSEPGDLPALAAVEAYVERTFGVWSLASHGFATLTDALVARLAERSVDLRLRAPVASLRVRSGRVVAAVTDDGNEFPADVVVTDIDPRTVLSTLLPGDVRAPARRVFERAAPAVPPTVAHLGLSGDLPPMPEEVVLHGDPLLVVTTTGEAPAGGAAWTVLRRGSAAEDVLVTLVRRGVDVRKQVVTRLDRSPADVVRETGTSPYGLAAAGWKAYVARATATHPVPGLHLLGASTFPGASVPYVAWGAARVAARIGPA